MPKWTSPLFSDIRNALEDNVIFSSWKGRPYFRAYVVPSQPNTNPQLAIRDDFRKIVHRWQGFIAGIPTFKQLWDNTATKFMISGYNLFLSYGRGSSITTTTVGPDVNITFDTNVPLTNFGIYRITGVGLPSLINEPTSTSGTLTDTPPVGTTSTYFIGYIFVPGETPSEVNLITKWKPNLETGIADEAIATV